MTRSYYVHLDLLRALAVLLVVAFHCNIEFFSGGFIGVDVFFVLSGFLITKQITTYHQYNIASLINFYGKRIARLVPSLCVTLFLILTYGFFYYDPSDFDLLGKEIFFAAITLLNWFYAQGVDYFNSNDSRLTSHLWSLSVEEQFYLIFVPMLMLLLRRRLLLNLVFWGVFVTSLLVSEISLHNFDKGSYYLLQFRAFELVQGTLLALHSDKLMRGNSYLAMIGLGIIILSSSLLKSSHSFPGFNALFPTIGTLLFIVFGCEIIVPKFFRFLGLISYPLYLLHQPALVIVRDRYSEIEGVYLFGLVLLLTVPGAWFLTKFVETPVRNAVRNGSKRLRRITLAACISGLCVTAIVGIIVAKNAGIPERLMLMNPFAYEMSTRHRSTFHSEFERGFEIREGGRILFVGDSLLQQYVKPISNALDVGPQQIDIVSRGGCVMLKGADFIDKIADISCNDIRNKIYNYSGAWDLVVFSQDWNGYSGSVNNFANREGVFKWETLINETIQHFASRSNKVLILGNHPSIVGADQLRVTMTITRDEYLHSLSLLRAELDAVATKFFDSFVDDNVFVVHPTELFCERRCVLHDQLWSYFSDAHHITSYSTAYLVGRLEEKFGEIGLRPPF